MRNSSKGTYLSHLIILAAATVALLLPFAGKAFHVDDTLFLWTARQILEKPWDFYGFQANWDGYLVPATDIIKDPPLAAYYLALAGSLAGFGEKALHTAFILPAFLAVWGTYSLARRAVSIPLYSAFLALATPAFLVSATTLMSDVLMTAFFVWAIFFWVKGVEDKSNLSLVLASVLVSAASLTKYFGVSLIPLLAAYSVLKGRRGISSLPFLLIPAAALAGYHLYTDALYGRGLLFHASSYPAGIVSGAERFDRATIAAVFAGGCVITALFVLPSVWGLKGIIPGAALVAASIVYFVSRKSLGPVELWTGPFGWGYAAQLAIYATAGIGIMALAVIDFLKRRDSFSVLLGIWVFGTLAFTVFFNWTVNGRSVLPMVPAVAVLLAREAAEGKPGTLRLWVPLALALAASLLVAGADYNLAGSARDAARTISAKYSSGPGRLWFQGNWGFQYYLEERGGRPIEWNNQRITSKDTIAFPFNNTGLRLMPIERFAVVEDLKYTPSRLVSTMTLGPGAGFYASEWGPLPFMLFPPNEERYQVMFPRFSE